MTHREAPAGTARTLLLVVAAVVLVESIAFLALAALDLRDVPRERLSGGIGIAVFLAGYGVAQLVAVRLLLRGRAGARAPLIVTQLLQLLVAITSASGGLRLVIGGAAVVVLACLLAPPVTRALGASSPGPVPD